MQGKKKYQEKLFTSFRLSDRVPQKNFYRRLKAALNLDFLYEVTHGFYGSSGQKSIDPVVFFKLCLVGYLENIISDRKLMEHCSMRLDILYFIGYDIDEGLPWHSTISRTRQLFPEEVFESVFTKVFSLCVEAGMVSGHTQAIDSAPVKANASMDTLELKVPEEQLESHLRRVRHISAMDKDQPFRKSKVDKSDKGQRSITANEQELQAISSRNKRWSKDQDQRPGSGNKGSKYTSNKTHYSPTDPDARISVKPGKARKLNYLCNMAVDTGFHVITDIHGYHADKKDNQYLQDTTMRLNRRLRREGLIWEHLLADAGYSSGENYHYLEGKGIKSYIPAHGTYKGGPEGFSYVKEGNYWLCPQGKKVTFRKQKLEKGTLKDNYFTKRSDCKGCPIKAACIGKSHEKRINITAYREEYEHNNQRVNSRLGRFMKGKRQSTVEPVFGILKEHLGLRKIYTIGIKQANKCMHLAAIAYNLKKYLKYTGKKVKTGAAQLARSIHYQNLEGALKSSLLSTPIFGV
ncbi:IS1182 family transposase [Zunongwangia pacifica]|uniref:IS1182 family transposase n=1 Tax=Zunongwangia pacifica TaxID=2911062 RepID=A0A9X2CMC0_9FLAO|nr:IS1182 family transposase [Zunongwangia pacifica]MCL6220981.1 IS1182 family transposase [Zunongwangia pacifica]